MEAIDKGKIMIGNNVVIEKNVHIISGGKSGRGFSPLKIILQ